MGGEGQGHRPQPTSVDGDFVVDDSDFDEDFVNVEGDAEGDDWSQEEAFDLVEPSSDKEEPVASAAEHMTEATDDGAAPTLPALDLKLAHVEHQLPPLEIPTREGMPAVPAERLRSGFADAHPCVVHRLATLTLRWLAANPIHRALLAATFLCIGLAVVNVCVMGYLVHAYPGNVSQRSTAKIQQPEEDVMAEFWNHWRKLSAEQQLSVTRILTGPAPPAERERVKDLRARSVLEELLFTAFDNTGIPRNEREDDLPKTAALDEREQPAATAAAAAAISEAREAATVDDWIEATWGEFRRDVGRGLRIPARREAVKDECEQEQSQEQRKSDPEEAPARDWHTRHSEARERRRRHHREELSTAQASEQYRGEAAEQEEPSRAHFPEESNEREQREEEERTRTKRRHDKHHRGHSRHWESLKRDTLDTVGSAMARASDAIDTAVDAATRGVKRVTEDVTSAIQHTQETLRKHVEGHSFEKSVDAARKETSRVLASMAAASTDVSDKVQKAAQVVDGVLHAAQRMARQNLRRILKDRE